MYRLETSIVEFPMSNLLSLSFSMCVCVKTPEQIGLGDTAARPPSSSSSSRHTAPHRIVYFNFFLLYFFVFFFFTLAAPARLFPFADTSPLYYTIARVTNPRTDENETKKNNDFINHM